jgi:hypothetical protein
MKREGDNDQTGSTVFNVTGGAAASIGNNNQVSNVTINSAQQQIDGLASLQELTAEFRRLAEALARKASGPEQYVDLGRIGNAQIEATKNNRHGVIEALKGTGKWVLDVAQEIGVKVAAELIKKSAGW